LKFWSSKPEIASGFLAG